MEASRMPSYNPMRYIWVVLLLCFGLTAQTQEALTSHVSYEILPTCVNPTDDRPASSGSFFILTSFTDLQVDDSGELQENFEITVEDGSPIQFFVDQEQLPYTAIFGPFTIPEDRVERALRVNLRSIDNGIGDELTVSEVLCGIETNNGLNQPGYMCTVDDQFLFAQAQPPPVNGDRHQGGTYVYVLADANGLIRGVNHTGLFNEVDDGSFRIELFSVANHEVESFVGAITLGEPLEVMVSSSCVASCGSYAVEFSCTGFDLALTKEVVGRGIYNVGDTVEYLITIINEGLVPAYGVVVRDLVPAGLRYVPELNRQWDEQALSLPTELIEAEDSTFLSIRMIVDLPATIIEIENIAEIINASDSPNGSSPAFDLDSTPDNANEREDDISSAGIIVLQALCDVTFTADLIDNGPFCIGQPILLEAQATSDNGRLSYSWEQDGNPISNESEINITNPTAQDYGRYTLIVADPMGCTASMTLNVEPALEERISCITELNVTVGSDCTLGLRPSMFTLNTVSAINDYILEVTDVQGAIVDLSDVSGNDLSEPLEVRLIHPCSGQTVCWSFVNADFKAEPDVNVYADTLSVFCGTTEMTSATEILERVEGIQSATDFSAMIQSQLCQVKGTISIEDQIFEDVSCGAGTVGRIYSLTANNRTFVLDTAVVSILATPIESVIFPADVSGLSCGASYLPQDISSLPMWTDGADTMQLRLVDNGAEDFCRISTTFSDQDSDELCSFGSRKILRSWTVIDWCTDQVISHLQHIYVVDQIAPVISTSTDTVVVALSGRICQGDIDLSAVIDIADNCDLNPEVIVEGYSSDQLFLQDVPVGNHEITIKAVDACGNSAIDTIHVIVTEQTPPVPVTVSQLNVSYNSGTAGWISAELFNNNSADACGPITVQIARATEVNQISSNGTIAVWELRDKCEEDFTTIDRDQDGELTIDEIYRDQILFCCEDLDQEIKVYIRVIDQFGNYAETDATVYLSMMDEPVVCDDGDPCTIGDRMQEGCPCRGSVDTSDLDEDGIPDCIDQDFVVCLDGETMSIERAELEEMLALGASAGPCTAAQQADISGETYTINREMIEDVLITKNSSVSKLTDIDGQYAFKSNEMYMSYELETYKNDDSLNGVTALDIVLIQQYLLGLSDFTDASDFLASDINNDGRISAVDIAELRRLVLGQIDSFSNHTSWIFMPADPGINEDNPYNYETKIEIEELTGHMLDQDWIGIKIGDVSGNAKTNSNKAQGRSSNQITMALPDITISSIEEIVIPFYIDQFIDMTAMQITVMGDFDIVGISSNQLNVSPEDYMISRELNSVRIVWTNPDIIEINDSELFSLVVRPQELGNLSEVLHLDIDYDNLIYDAGRQDYEVNMVFSDELSSEQSDLDRLYQNEPNPFVDYTNIPIYLSSDQQVTLTFYNVSGQVILVKDPVLTRGHHEIRIDRRELTAASDIIYYELITDQTRVVRSMILTSY
jgi:uncharacterized repeat protein (TIGR01451 family)